jgi:hypothetical protein
MNVEQTEKQSLHISPEKLLAFVEAMIGQNRGREDDDHPLPPGPWDPIIRMALERVYVFGPQPQPWIVALANFLAKHPEIYDAIGGGHRFGEEVELNPQPLPPRFAFMMAVAQAVTSRAELLQEIADATTSEGEQRGIIIVSGYIDRFADDFCNPGFKLKYPFPRPRPHWFTPELDGMDLVVMAAQFRQASKEAYSPDLCRNLADASVKFVEVGLSKMR